MGTSLDREEWLSLLTLALRAPSGGNVQAWRFVANAAGELRCYLDRVRGANFLDFEFSASYLAVGSAVESLVLAARARGFVAEVEPPSSGDPDHVCTVSLSRSDAAPAARDVELADELERRATNRHLGSGKPLPAGQLDALSAAAEQAGAQLRYANGKAEKGLVAAVVGGCDRIRMLSEQMHRELMGEVRWTVEEAERTCDGVDVRTLEVNAVQRMLLRRLASFGFVDGLRRLGLAGALEGMGAQSVKAASAVALLTVPGTDHAAYFRGGRALQRVWLTASALGIGFQPLAVPPYLFARLLRGDGFTQAELQQLEALRSKLNQAFPGLSGGEAEVMMFRLTDAPPPSTVSLRRPVELSLAFQ